MVALTDGQKERPTDGQADHQLFATSGDSKILADCRVLCVIPIKSNYNSFYWYFAVLLIQVEHVL